MTAFTNTRRFSLNAFAIAATAFAVLHGGMLMGFDQLASNGHSSPVANQMAKANATATPMITLERVVITSHRA